MRWFVLGFVMTFLGAGLIASPTLMLAGATLMVVSIGVMVFNVLFPPAPKFTYDDADTADLTLHIDITVTVTPPDGSTPVGGQTPRD